MAFAGVTMRRAPAANWIRYNAASASGQAMLGIYADAVKKMMAKSPDDPLSWTFQWYTHAIPTNTTKDAEIKKLFPGPSPARALAEDVWDTCEPHFSQLENNFLPWHRMFVECFEEIVRFVSGHPEFTLPYWDYTDPTHRAMPAEFLKRNDPAWDSLFRGDRNKSANDSDPIDSVPGSLPINLSAMMSDRYDDGGKDAGFCANLDNTPHGSVHVDVGNSFGMGSVPWAANDPIFWLHHCNIDRIWASWNKAGGQNPSDADFKKQPFAFTTVMAGTAARTQIEVGDVLDMKNMLYDYDEYLARPVGSTPFTIPIAALALQANTGLAAASGPISLSAERTTVTLQVRPTGATAPTGQKNLFSSQIRALPPSRRLYLRLNGLQADAEVGAAYDVYLNLPRDGQPSRNSPNYVGTVSFFGTGMHHTMPMGMKKAGRNVSFQVGDTARRVATEVQVPQVTFVPVGEVEAGSAPRITSVQIVSE